MEEQQDRKREQQPSMANAEHVKAEGPLMAQLAPPPLQLRSNIQPQPASESTEEPISSFIREKNDPTGILPPPDQHQSSWSPSGIQTLSDNIQQQSQPYQLKEVIQRKNFTDKYADSSFQLSDKKDEAIYMISKGDTCEYIGKTSQGVPKRFNQHKSAKGLDAGYATQGLVKGKWTPFETATHEQYWLGEGGGKGALLNKINALDKDKWNWFKTPTGQGHNANQETDLTDDHF